MFYNESTSPLSCRWMIAETQSLADNEVAQAFLCPAHRSASPRAEGSLSAAMLSMTLASLRRTERWISSARTRLPLWAMSGTRRLGTVLMVTVQQTHGLPIIGKMPEDPTVSSFRCAPTVHEDVRSHGTSKFPMEEPATDPEQVSSRQSKPHSGDPASHCLPHTDYGLSDPLYRN